jgi:hypothetical protein
MIRDRRKAVAAGRDVELVRAFLAKLDAAEFDPLLDDFATRHLLSVAPAFEPSTTVDESLETALSKLGRDEAGPDRAAHPRSRLVRTLCLSGGGRGRRTCRTTRHTPGPGRSVVHRSSERMHSRRRRWESRCRRCLRCRPVLRSLRSHPRPRWVSYYRCQPPPALSRFLPAPRWVSDALSSRRLRPGAPSRARWSMGSAATIVLSSARACRARSLGASIILVSRARDRRPAHNRRGACAR